MDPSFRWDDGVEGFRRNEKKELDPGLRRDDEVRGLRRNDEIGRERGAHTKHEHHPHPTLPLKGRAKEKAETKTSTQKKAAVPKDGGTTLQKTDETYWQTSTLKLSMTNPFGAVAAVFESVVMR
jgi:hypothetical protein